MAAIPITQTRRYRVGQLKMVLCRYSGGSAGAGNSTAETITRFSRILGALACAHVVSQASQPAHRVNLNFDSGTTVGTVRNGYLGVAATNAATGSYLMIGR